MVVQHNLSAMNANRTLGITTSAQAKSSEKLSSGYRINRAADDAAGLTISEKMRKQIRGLDQASTNAEDGVSSVQTAEGALTEVHSMLQRMNELATQAANGTNASSDRESIQQEMEQLTTEIDRVAETTKFNEIYLLKGEKTGATKTNTLAAHDAGLGGKLTDNGDGTTTFKLDDALAVGDNVSIGGTDYTIGKSAVSTDYDKKGNSDVKPVAVGDSVTSSGVTTSIVGKVTTATATGATWATNDIIKDKDGNTLKFVADAATPAAGEIRLTDGKKLLEDGASIVSNADNTTLNGTSIVDDLGKNEISIADSTGIKALQDGIKVGDTVTVGGTSKTVTAETPKTMDELKTEVDNAGDGLAVAIGSTTYTLGIATDADAGTITQDDFLAKIKDGDKVTVDGVAFTAIGKADSDDVNTITAAAAYTKMADELTTASSIGTDKAATVKNNNNGTFEITQGTVEVKQDLSFNLHVGADADSTNKIAVNIASMDAAGLGIKDINVVDENGTAATYALDSIADAIATVSSQRSALGAVQNRLEHTIANVDNIVENTTSAESRIRDTDMATEMVNYSKNNILVQAGQSMLAQANQSNQGVLSLLQ